jgi:tRNA G10  N-methylase Trm11
MPEYLVRLVQVHESFRKAELQALADLAGTDLEFVKYDEDVSAQAMLLPLLVSPVEISKRTKLIFTFAHSKTCVKASSLPPEPFSI